MAKQEKICDLSSRLVYGIYVKDKDNDKVIYTLDYHPNLDNCKAYLRPMSDMSEEEEREICQFMEGYNLLPGPNKAAVFCGIIADWLNKHYFDYRGLIEKGLALVAPKDMYNFKTNQEQ